MQPLFSQSDLITMFPAIVLLIVSILLISNKTKVFAILSKLLTVVSYQLTNVLSVVKTFLF